MEILLWILEGKLTTVCPFDELGEIVEVCEEQGGPVIEISGKPNMLALGRFMCSIFLLELFTIILSFQLGSYAIKFQLKL